MTKRLARADIFGMCSTLTLGQSLLIFAGEMRPIYLDYNATTPVDARVIAAMQPYWSEDFGNASSIHRHGQQARRGVNRARRQVAQLIGATEPEIIFTSGGTEANHLALVGSIEARGSCHVITSAAEHSAVLEPLQRLQRSGRITLTILPVDRYGSLSTESVVRALQADTVLISLMLANNEVGTLLPIADIAHAVRQSATPQQHVVIHTDAVQAVGKIPVDVSHLGVDLLSCSAHKLYGPKGVGALYVRGGTPLSAQFAGGGQERRMRAGTENVPAIVGFGCACDVARSRQASEQLRLAELRASLRDQLSGAISGMTVNGDPAHYLPNTLNLSFAGIEGEALLMNLDLHGIAASTGSACASGKTAPSHVLLAMGLSAEHAKSSLRISLGAATTSAEISTLVGALTEIVSSLRKRGGQTFIDSSVVEAAIIAGAPC